MEIMNKGMEIMSPYLLRGLTQQQQKDAPALFWIKSALSPVFVQLIAF